MPRKEHTSAVKRYRAKHRERGLCTMCSDPAEPGRVKCAYHLDEEAELHQRIYARRIGTGQCQKCTHAVFAGSTYCERHMKAKRRVRRAKYGHTPRPGMLSEYRSKGA